MIDPGQLYDFFLQQQVNFYTGVPDSLLKHFIKYVEDKAPTDQHIITANEGLALSLATGYYLQTAGLPLIYLQNSGLGNLVNPLTSLADKEMYGIPMLLMVGWRGKPGTRDEPQHLKMGRITKALLETLEVPYYILDENPGTVFENAGLAIARALKEQRPVALLVTGDIFSSYRGTVNENSYSLVREDVIGQIIEKLSGVETVVCTTGKTGREFYEQNRKLGNKISKYFLSVGAMGHANHIGLGIILGGGGPTVILDGDGALLMHLGSLPSLAHHGKKGIVHILINNGSHESVGSQPTEGFFADISKIAQACGYKKTTRINDSAELNEWLNSDWTGETSEFVEIRTNNTSRTDLGRPMGDPISWKKDFMNALQSNK